MTVEENIAFGIRSLPVAERRARVRELIEMLHLTGLDSRPAIVRRSRPEGAFVRVVLDCGFRLSALVTRAGWEHLHLAPGDHAVAMVKAASIRVLRRH